MTLLRRLPPRAWFGLVRTEGLALPKAKLLLASPSFDLNYYFTSMRLDRTLPDDARSASDGAASSLPGHPRRTVHKIDSFVLHSPYLHNPGILRLWASSDPQISRCLGVARGEGGNERRRCIMECMASDAAYKEPYDASPGDCRTLSESSITLNHVLSIESR